MKYSGMLINVLGFRIVYLLVKAIKMTLIDDSTC